MPIFDLNHKQFSLQKSQFFFFFPLLFLQSLNEVLLSKILGNTFSWPILPKMKRMEQLPIFDQDNELFSFEKSHFPSLYCLKKKVGKMAIFGPKPWVNPFGKMSIFRLYELLVFIAQKGVFSFQNIVNVNFSTFEVLVFIAQKGLFSFQNIVKDIFLAYNV